MNGTILLAGRTLNAHTILQRLAGQELFLATNTDTIPLRTTATISEEKHSKNTPHYAELLLSPERPLPSGAQCRLIAGDASEQQGIPELAWRISTGTDTIRPRWNGLPSYIGGCDREGESHYAYVAIPVNEPIIVQAQLVSVDDSGNPDTATALFLPRPNIVEQFSGAILISDEVILQLDPAMNGNRISVDDYMILPIGDGVYGGDFTFEAGKEYQISLTLIDGAGNRSEEIQEGSITLPARPERKPKPATAAAPSTTEGPTAGGATATERRDPEIPQSKGVQFGGGSDNYAPSIPSFLRKEKEL